jgi:hypothetical protein
MFPGKMLRLIKVLRLNEASTILPSQRPGTSRGCPPSFSSANIGLSAHLHEIPNLIWTGIRIRPWTRKLLSKPKSSVVGAREKLL